MSPRSVRGSPSESVPEGDPRTSRGEYAEAVLALAESVPPARVISYGGIADALESGGPRQVGKVMALEGAAVPWWRVVRADGTLPDRLRARAREHYLAEGTPLRGGIESRTRVDMPAAEWFPHS